MLYKKEKMRFTYFDGLKGLSAIIVMQTHFAICFQSISWLQDVPIIGMLFDGGMAVYIFVILSSFGICCSISASTMETAVIKIGVKRFFRLMLPLILPSIVAFVLAGMNLNYCYEIGCLENNEWTENLLPKTLSINQLTSGVLVGVLKGSALINPLWMMKYIFLGSFIVLPVLVVAKNITNISFRIVYLLMAFILSYSVSPYYSAVIIGVILFFTTHSLANCRTKCRMLIFGISLMSVLLLHWLVPYNTKYIRAVFLILMISMSSHLKSFLSKAPWLFLNRISYQLYLVHASVLASLCSWLYLITEYSCRAMLFNFGVFIGVTFLVALIFTKVDVIVSRGLDKFYKSILHF